MIICCRAKQRIDRRAIAVFLGPTRYKYTVGFNQKVVVWRSDINMTCPNLFSVFWVNRRQSSGPAKNSRQFTDEVWRDMEYDKNGGVQSVG